MIKCSASGLAPLVIMAACTVTSGTDHEMVGVLERNWNLVFEDCGTRDWQENWFLDGLRASVSNTPKGMYFQSGPVSHDDASHAVLWTKRSFYGDIRIEYEYTRMDAIYNAVNLLYFHATGIGEGLYEKDILRWSHLREIPRMSLYFNHMNLLHISYAAYPMDVPGNRSDYIRVRQYPVPPNGDFERDTAIGKDYWDTGLFEPGVPHQMTIVLLGTNLFLRISTDTVSRDYHWDTSDFPLLDGGRIGLRQMWTRAARYRNFKVYRLEENE